METGMKFVLAVNPFGKQTGKSMQGDKQILSGESKEKDRYKGTENGTTKAV